MEERRRLERDINSRLSELNTDYETLLKQVKRESASLKSKNKELEREVSRIREEIAQRDKGNSDEAAESLRNAQEILRVVDNKPHEKFLPGRFEIYSNSLKDGRQLFRAGLFEAAAAVGVSVRTGLERFNFTLDDKVKEWEKSFELFNAKLESLREKVNKEISDWGKVIDKHVRAEIINDIDYWSRNQFLEVVNLIKNYREIFKQSSQTGIEKFIKSPESPSVNELKKFIDDIDEAEKKFLELNVIYKARYYSACERSDMGENIIDFMTREINLEWQEALTGYHDNDFREWLKIIFLNSSGDKICVYVIPVETESKVNNHVVLHIEYNSSDNEIYSRDIHEHLQESLKEYENAIELANDIESLKASSNKSYRETAKDIEQMRKEFIKS